MKIDGINLIEGSKIVNVTVDSGTAFPSLPNVGELFFRTDSPNAGLYFYEGASWLRSATGSSLVAGGDSEIQFNDGGTSLGSDPDFKWNKTSNVLTISAASATDP